MDMIRLLFEEGNPVGIKGSWNLWNLFKKVRLPLVSASSHLVDKIEKVFNNSFFDV